MRAIVSVICGLLFAGAAHAGPQDKFGGPQAPATRAVADFYKCEDVRESSGYWTCETKVNVGQGIGLVDLDITVRYRSPPMSGGVVAYTFETPKRRLIRDTSFHGILGFSNFFGAEARADLETRENYEAYLKGQDVFEAGGLLFEVEESSSSFQLNVLVDRGRLSVISDLEPDLTNCDQTGGLAGWHVSWSEDHASIEPALKPVSSEYGMVSGMFSINPKREVTPSFREAFGGGGKEFYVTMFVDSNLVYQGQWVEKSEPTCCSYSLDTKLPLDTLFELANGKTGMIILSSDNEVTHVLAASHFDMSNIGKAADMAIGGRRERGAMKSAGRCR